MNKQYNRNGSALLLVVVVTVLLAAVAALFILLSRVNEMESSAYEDDRSITSGVNTVLEQIERLLAEDLFDRVDTNNPGYVRHLLAEDTSSSGVRPNYSNTGAYNEPYDYPSVDSWLSSIEPEFIIPDPSTKDDDDTYWPYISDLWGLNSSVLGYHDPVVYDYATRCWDLVGLPAYYTTDYKITSARYTLARVVDPRQTTQTIQEGDIAWGATAYMLDYGARADADGDGVADSRWMPIPGIRTTKGRKVYAAVKIIDNCAMLNLNTAHSIGATDASPIEYYGKYLSEVDFSDFLRGYDVGEPDRIRIARSEQDWISAPAYVDDFEGYYNNVILNIESPGEPYTLFDLSDELEMRNRFMLTSGAIARFEKRHLGITTADRQAVYPDYIGTAYYTFDFERGNFGSDNAGAGYWSTRVRRIPFDTSNFDKWKARLDHSNWDNTLAAAGYEYMYDRRHVCTFYSFDRNLRRRQYPLIDPTDLIQTEDTTKIDNILSSAPGVFLPEPVSADIRGICENSTEARTKILHLLYAFRAYFVAEQGDDYKTAARKSAQFVANMIDYLDSESDPSDPIIHPFLDPAYGSQLPENLTYIDESIVEQLVTEVSGVAIDFTNSTTHWPNSADTDLPVMAQFAFGLDATDVIYGYEPQPFITELYAQSDGYDIQNFSIELYNPYSDEIHIGSGWRIGVGATYYDIPAGISVAAGGRQVIEHVDLTSPAPFDLSLGGGTESLTLQRQRPDDPLADYLIVDMTEPSQLSYLLSPGPPGGTYVSKRVDTGWEFTNYLQHREDSSPTLHAANYTTDPDSGLDGYQLPVADTGDRWGSLIDLVRVSMIGNDSDGPVTRHMADALGYEGNVRYDCQAAPELFEYVSLLNRDNGRIPGRININTATKEVLMAAIPPSENGIDWNREDIADAIIAGRPYASISEIAPLMDDYMDGADNLSSTTEIPIDDFEERDWLFSLVFNKFTVRSDVFTAYILVRIDVDGPEKRMIAVFDRSQVYTPDDKPKLVALHPVPDPR